MDDLEEILMSHTRTLEMTFNGFIKEYPDRSFDPMFIVLTDVDDEDDMILLNVGHPEDDNMPQHVFNMAVVTRGYLSSQQMTVTTIIFAVDTYVWMGETETDAPPGGDSLSDLFRRGHPKVSEALYVVGCDNDHSLDAFVPYTRTGQIVLWGRPFHPEMTMNGCNLALEAAFRTDIDALDDTP